MFGGGGGQHNKLYWEWDGGKSLIGILYPGTDSTSINSMVVRGTAVTAVF